MSIISDAIQAKCLAFGDRVIKLNDYLLTGLSLCSQRMKSPDPRFPRQMISPNQIVDHRTDAAEEYNEAFVETGELESLW